MSSSKPHVLLISYYFPPDNAVGGLRPSRFHKYLNELGYTCETITASPQPEPAPGVIHVPDPTSAMWGGNQTQSWSAVAQAERLIRKFFLPGQPGISWCHLDRGQKVVVFSTYPPISAHLAGLQAVRGNPAPWIADFRDPLSAEPTLHSIKRIPRFAFFQVERATVARSAAVIANVDSTAALFRSHHPSAADKVHVIPNGFDPARQPIALPVSGLRKAVVHAGSLYADRNANLALESIARLRERGHQEALNTVIRLVGQVSSSSGLDESLHEKASREGWLEMKAAVPGHEAERLTCGADGLLLLQPQSKLQVPAKLFEYISIGRPILAIAPRDSAIEAILSRAGIPYVCLHPEDDPEVRDAKLERYLALPVAPVSPSPWFLETYDARRQTAQLGAIIDAVSEQR
jgi:glycosyltransferase involved in cell wall biosynthesis